jgi:hypothetical protein
MSKLLIQTQIQENYATHDWDGQGEVPQYWKFKGGNDYFVPNFTDYNNTTAAVMAMRGQIEQSSDYFIEQIISWEIVADDYMTDFERSQFEYEGKVTYPAKTISL